MDFHVIHRHQLDQPPSAHLERAAQVDVVRRPAPTPYAEVNELLARLLARQLDELGPRLVGLYLFGSLSWGDFDPATSDVDFLAVTRGRLDPALIERLRTMHDELAGSGLPWATKLEGSYISRRAVRRFDPTNAIHPTIGVDWPFGLARHREHWIIERHIVRERGVTLFGPAPATLIDEVTPGDLRDAVRAILRAFWSHQLSGPDWLRPLDYQAFAILTMCRALYTIATGAVASKALAAAWAQDALPPPWPATVSRALATRGDSTPGGMDDLLAFMRYAIDRGLATASEPTAYRHTDRPHPSP